MKHILAVYDVDPVYAARFAEVVNQKEKIPFEVVAFSSIERLRAFAAEHPVKLLLLGEHVPAEEKESIRAEKVILLSDNGGKPVSPSVPCVYKYQSSDAIVRDVMTWYGESPGELPGKLFSFKCMILIAVIVLSILFYRPFCKWICPLGAIYSLFNKVSLLKITVDSSKCVGCGQCSKACKMDVDVCKTPDHPECIRCGACIRACPKDAICYRFMGKSCQKNDNR